MTINIAIKCVDGIVLGADSLMTRREGERSTPFPYHGKLFALGDLPIGVMISGEATTASTTAKAVVQDFIEEVAPQYRQGSYQLEEVARDLYSFMLKRFGRVPPVLTVALGGYSRGKQRSFGEVWILKLPLNRRKPEGAVTPAYPGNQDFQFGIKYLGSPEAKAAVERFMYGMDTGTILEIAIRSDALFKRVSAYVIEQLKKLRDVKIPDTLTELEPPGKLQTERRAYVEAFDVFRLVHNLEHHAEPIDPDMAVSDPESFIQKHLSQLLRKYHFLDRYLSLPMAVQLCRVLLLCAHARHNLADMPQGPDVGSQLTVATVTRERGFEHVLSWLPMSDLRVCV
jgi:hypothetical protein